MTQPQALMAILLECIRPGSARYGHLWSLDGLDTLVGLDRMAVARYIERLAHAITLGRSQAVTSLLLALEDGTRMTRPP